MRTSLIVLFLTSPLFGGDPTKDIYGQFDQFKQGLVIVHVRPGYGHQVTQWANKCGWKRLWGIHHNQYHFIAPRGVITASSLEALVSHPAISAIESFDTCVQRRREDRFDPNQPSSYDILGNNQ